LVYTHGHNDRVRGAGGLPRDLAIISTTGIRDDIPDDEKEAKSDVMAVLPRDRVVFAGDLLFVHHHPFFRDGPGSTHRLKGLDYLESPSPARYGPGRSLVSGQEAVAPPRDYVASLRMLAAESRRQGLTAEWLGPREMPAQFRDWSFGRFYPDNIQTLLKEADAAK
jgi:hypothetical protein